MDTRDAKESKGRKEPTATWVYFRDLVIRSVVQAMVWAVAAVVMWALYTAYAQDAKFERKHHELRGEMIDGLNSSVNRDADLQDQINVLYRSIRVGGVAPRPDQHPMPPPVFPGNQAPPVPPSDDERMHEQRPLDYIQDHSKKFGK